MRRFFAWCHRRVRAGRTRMLARGVHRCAARSRRRLALAAPLPALLRPPPPPPAAARLAWRFLWQAPLLHRAHNLCTARRARQSMSTDGSPVSAAAGGGGGGGDASAPPPHQDGAKLPHLVLHFDVNKTILLCDPVSGMDVLGMLQSCVSECAWGLVDLETGEWALTHTEPLFAAPSALHTTFSDFLEYGRFKLEDNAAGDAAVAARNKKAKADKKLHKKIFTDPGQPGERMRHVYEAMVDKLRIPEGLREECARHELEHLHGEFAFLLPSFFRSLDALQREGRTFSVIFRTFGTETQEVADSFNAFRRGQHPFVPNPACTDPTFHASTIEFPKQLGCFKRSVVTRTAGGRGSQDGAGVVDASAGGSEGQGGPEEEEEEEEEEVIRLCLGTIDPARTAPYRVVEGFAAIHAFLEAESLRGVNFALRDDYPFWASRAEASTAGKPHAVVAVPRGPPPAAAAVVAGEVQEEQQPQRPCHHIFFDDNIERTHAHIVDCRDAGRGGAPIAFRQALDRWMVKAEPVQALMDDLYFRKAIAVCEANVAATAAAVGAGP